MNIVIIIIIIIIIIISLLLNSYVHFPGVVVEL